MFHSFLRNHLVELLLVLFVLVFSFWLMFHTFSYSDGAMRIAIKAWSDFASHIPLIRSFSFGQNVPPQYPLFPGEPIRYHFLFYFFVGMLEKMGIRIDYALNMLSTFSFAVLVSLVYLLAKTLFQSKTVGILSAVFFLFNGSLSFLEFFKDHPLSLSTLRDITMNTTFPSFAPYGKGIVSAFWNLNIYTNQRHLAGAYGLSLLLIFLLLKPNFLKQVSSLKLGIFIGLVLGLSLFFHMAVFFMTVIVVGMVFLLLPKARLSSFVALLVAAVIALPQYATIHSAASTFKISFNPGYLLQGDLTLVSFLNYWYMNLGLHTIFIPLGFLLAQKNAKKLLLAVVPLFIIGNLFQFSVEIAANHKFFNYVLLFGVMFSAYFLVAMWKKITITRPFIIICSIFLVFSGIVDFFPIYNDGKITLLDYPKNPDVKWIIENTPKDAVFLNSTYLYHPASLAGRKIFLGWPYFAWSQGYDTLSRDILRKKLLSGSDISTFCQAATEHNLWYVTLEQIDSHEDYMINESFFARHFTKVYENRTNGFTIYTTKTGCDLTNDI